jgi:hypothetical protein
MNENYQADFVEETEDVELTSEATEAAIEDDWYSDGVAERPEAEETAEDASNETQEADQQTEEVVAENDTPPAEEQEAQQTEEAANQSGEEEKEAEPAKAADQLLSVKHLDTVRELDWNKDRAEIKSLIQKGMDYDRKTQKLSDTIAEYEAFLDEIAAPAGLNRTQLMDSIRARALVASEAEAGRTITETEALFRVQQSRADKKRVAEEEAQAENQRKQAEAERQQSEMLQRFATTYPEVKAADIPAEVWAETRKSGDLVSAWAKYENARLKREKAELERRISTMENNAKNAQRSTGSQKSAGNATEDSAFDAAWYDGT